MESSNWIFGTASTTTGRRSCADLTSALVLAAGFNLPSHTASEAIRAEPVERRHVGAFCGVQPQRRWRRAHDVVTREVTAMEIDLCILTLLLTELQKRHTVNHFDSTDNPPSMTTDRTRTTISIDTDIYNDFVLMAKKQGVSVSRWMGDWLATTVESAQFVSYKMDEVRRIPRESMKALHDKTIAEMQDYRATAPTTPRLVTRGVIKSDPVAPKKEKP